MAPASLPSEIWILIIDILMEAIINPIHNCDHMNFPQINDSLRYPRPVFRHHPLYQHLRLVCRLFREILPSPPRLFMKDGKTKVPAGTRAVYIIAKEEPLGCFKGLLEDPSRSRRISLLDMRVADNGEEIPTFYFLCQNAHLLPRVRNLALDIATPEPTNLDIRVWEGLNEAFPELISLVLRPRITVGVGQDGSAVGEERAITFRKLEVLEVDQVSLPPGLIFPLLRHVALGCWYQQVVEVLLRSPLLESLLVRKLLCGGGTDRIDSSQLQRLKLPGLPVYGENMEPPLPTDYPLRHLCAHIPRLAGGPMFVEWVKKMPARLPALSRITLDLTAVNYDRRAHIESPFRCINPELRSSGLVINELLSMASFIIVERIVETPTVLSPTGQLSTRR